MGSLAISATGGTGGAYGNKERVMGIDGKITSDDFAEPGEASRIRDLGGILLPKDVEQAVGQLKNTTLAQAVPPIDYASSILNISVTAKDAEEIIDAFRSKKKPSPAEKFLLEEARYVLDYRDAIAMQERLVEQLQEEGYVKMPEEVGDSYYKEVELISRGGVGKDVQVMLTKNHFLKVTLSNPRGLDEQQKVIFDDVDGAYIEKNDPDLVAIESWIEGIADREGISIILPPLPKAEFMYECPVWTEAMKQALAKQREATPEVGFYMVFPEVTQVMYERMPDVDENGKSYYSLEENAGCSNYSERLRYATIEYEIRERR